MRYRAATWLIGLLGLCWPSGDLHAQYRPRGRVRHTARPAVQSGKGTGVPSKPPTPLNRDAETLPPGAERRDQATNEGDATLARLIERARGDWTNTSLLQRLATAGQLHPAALARQTLQLQAEVAGQGPRAAGALILLHVLSEQRGDAAESERLLERMTREYAEHPQVLEYRGERAARAGNRELAIEHLTRALAQLTQPDARLRVLRRLRDWSIDSGAVSQAIQWHTKLVSMTPNRASLALEFGRILLSHSQYRTALSTLLPLTNLTTWTPGERDELLTLVTSAALREGDTAAAQKAVEFALSGRATLSDELRRAITDLYRTGSGLEALVRRIAARRPRGSTELTWLAELHEELGQLEPAVALRRDHVRLSPGSLDAHLALLRTLEIAGDRAATLKEREVLVRRFPHRSDQALLLVDELRQRGNTEAAEALLTRIEQGIGSDTELLYRVADTWERVGKRARAEALLKRVGAKGPEGDVASSMPSTTDPAGSARLSEQLRAAEVAITSGNVAEALKHVDSARQSTALDPAARIEVAKLLERAAASATKEASSLREEAERLWTSLLESAQLSEAQTRTCIDHAVRLWAHHGSLPEHTSQLAERFGHHPDHKTLGWWLAEAQTRLERYGEAEGTLREVERRHPGNSATLQLRLGLAMKRESIAEALQLTEQRIRRQPSDLPELTQQLVDYAERLKQDDVAHRYAQRWVDIAPSDPNAWYFYAKLLRRLNRQEHDEDKAALHRAIDLAPSRPELALELANWEAQDGQASQAFTRTLAVLRQCEKESCLIEAGRMAAALGTASGAIEAVELALRNACTRRPESRELRSLLLDTEALLIQVATPESPSQTNANSDPNRALTDANRSEITRRAASTFSAALLDPAEPRKALVLDWITKTGGSDIARELLTYAQTPGHAEWRTRAVLLAAQHPDPKLLAGFVAILQPTGFFTPDNALAHAAAFGVSRIRTPESTRVLRSLLNTGTPELRGWAALWLAERKAHGCSGELKQLAKDSGASPLTRAAAKLAWLHLSTTDGAIRNEAAPAHLEVAPTMMERRVQLAQVSRPQGTVDPELTAQLLTFEAMEGDWETATAIAACRLGAAETEWSSMLDTATDRDLEATMSRLCRCEATSDHRALLLSELAVPLGNALSQAIAVSSEQAKAIGRWLISNPAAQKTTGVASMPVSASLAGLSPQSAMQLMAPVAERFGKWLDDSNDELRALAVAIRVGVLQDEQALLLGLADAAEENRLSALTWAGYCPTRRVLESISQRMRSDDHFEVRRQAAAMLAELVEPPGSPQYIAAYREAARRDPFASVRMAALSGLFRTNPLAARDELRYAELHDREPEVIALARKLREHRP